MILSARSKQRLNEWLSSDWWSSGHTSDTERFYQFIGQYVADHGALRMRSQQLLALPTIMKIFLTMFESTGV